MTPFPSVADHEPEPQVLPPASGGRLVARSPTPHRGHLGGTRPSSRQCAREELHQARQYI